MRSIPLILIFSAALAGCASDRSLTGPSAAPDPTALLVRAEHVVARCAQPSGSISPYIPYYVLNGRVFTPDRAGSLAHLDPAEITAIELLQGEQAAARYGSVAGIVGVVDFERSDRTSAIFSPLAVPL
jgi:hypothetical protein